MARKRNKFINLMISAAIVLAICLSMMIPSLAAVYTEGTDAKNPAKAAITKVFNLPINTPTPATEFTFTFTAIGMENDTITTGMPNINPMTISFAAGVDPVGGTFIDEIEGEKNVVKESSDIVAGLANANWANGEGVYRYMLKETPSGIPVGDPELEGAVYSPAWYEIEFWVEWDEINEKYFVKYVCAITVEDHIDEYYEGDEGGTKVDPTPGGTNTTPVTEIEDAFSALIFTNIYWKTDGGGPGEWTLGALEINKTIKGNGANLEAYFEFAIKATRPSLIPDDGPYAVSKSYNAYILDAADDIIVPIAANALTGASVDQDGLITFTSGVEFKISLTNGQRLVFVDLPIGSKVEAMESAADGYKASYVRTFAGTLTYTAPSANIEWGFPRVPGDVGPHYTIAGANANIAAFTNTRSGATPTGIDVDNLPYIVLIGVAIAGLVSYVVARSRRKARGNA